jgi:hypothetical protein
MRTLVTSLDAHSPHFFDSDGFRDAVRRQVQVETTDSPHLSISVVSWKKRRHTYKLFPSNSGLCLQESVIQEEGRADNEGFVILLAPVAIIMSQ